MKQRLIRRILAGGLTFALALSCLTPASGADAVQTATPRRVSVHDPSILKADGEYYVFGSHLAYAKSTDLVNWQQCYPDYNADRNWKTNSIYGNILDNLSESFQWAGYDDGDCSNGSLAVWAPDVIWNPHYEWDDGTKGAYMAYYSASSTWRRSCIGFAVSKNATGPYSYRDTLVYSGFTTTGAVDGASTRNTKWDNDYLNLKELIQEGTLEGVSSKWFFDDGNYNTNYAPNAIDPTLFFDKDGKLWMVYGSWSGGLYLLEIDERTGTAKYPGKDDTDPVSGNFIDRYFGTHIAGGNHQSGEGPYILYDEQTDYYYLYETYGGLLGDGGYNMRLFRSKNVTGPYEDAKGQNANKNNRNNDNYGIKLIGNYRFPENTKGYTAAGHNSALIDDDGSHYLIYHQRFSDNIYYHEVRVHQQFMNEDGWPVTAVYENRGETIAHYTKEDVAGTYNIINHGTATNATMITSSELNLGTDGTVSGNFTGTWEMTAGENYDFITITTGSTVYKGVLFRQYNDKAVPEQVMTFSAIGNNNTSLWGSSKTSVTPQATAAPTATPKPTTPTAKPTQTPKVPVTPSPSPSAIPSPDTTDEPAADDGGDEEEPVKKPTLKKPSLTVKAGKKKATLTWKKVANANGYQIQYSKKKNMKSSTKVKVSGKTTTKKVIKKLSAGKTYYFRIRAYAKSGGKTVYGTYSAKKKAKV